MASDAGFKPLALKNPLGFLPQINGDQFLAGDLGIHRHVQGPF